MDIFRFALKQNEISLRVYRLTTLVISMNSGNYTAWYVRRKCLDQLPELGAKLLDEIGYLNANALEMTKVYQYWHHRRLVINKFGALPPNEYETLQKIYNEDDKNYHMWTYRMWLTQNFSQWKDEEKDIVKKIETNPKNNSAWSYRYFITFHNVDYTKVARGEIEFLKSYLAKDLDNESVWVYYKGVLFATADKCTVGDKKAAAEEAEKLQAEAEGFCKKVLETDKESRFARSVLVDLYRKRKETAELAKKVDPES